MAKTILKLKKPVSELEVDMEEASLEAAGYVKVVRCEDERRRRCHVTLMRMRSLRILQK